VKRAVSIPVIASGRVEPEQADTHIGQGHFDCLAMGRKLLADPELPNKLVCGKPDQVLPCIYCYTCVSAIYTREPVRCAINPDTGLEYLAEDLPKRKDLHAVIVGGGPGGMEAARLLAQAGNKVTLLERGDRLGGTLQFASLAYKANERLLNWLRQQVAALPVDIRLCTPATDELIQSLKPDVVIVATGAKREMPGIKGCDQSHVFSGEDMRRLMLGESSDSLKHKTSRIARLLAKLGAVTGITRNLGLARKATRWWMPLGKHIGIIGGELVGLELAEFLNERGRQVTVIDESGRLGSGLTLVRRMRLLSELQEHGVSLFPSSSGISIEANGIRFTDGKDEARHIEVDQVIVAKGATGELSLAEALRAQGLEVHTVGDCNGVGYIEGAIRGAKKAVSDILVADH